jgi:hypothetical protein
MTELAVFGNLILATDVDEAALATLELWLPTYLGQIETERDLTAGSLPRPTGSSFASTLSDDEFLDHALPAVLATTVGTTGAPVVAADASYEVTWHLTVSCVLRGRTAPETRRNVSLFEGCVRRLLVQQGSLGKRVSGTKWVGTNVASVADRTRAGRYLAAGITQFNVFTDQAVQGRVGPVAPANPDPPGTPPYLPLATVASVAVEVDGQLIEGGTP